ncbi:hypothetical protein ACFL6S_15960 [Candidatus Poribacteria bacterium]
MTVVTVRFIMIGPVIIPLSYLLCGAVFFGMAMVGLGFLTRMFRVKGMQKKVLAQQDALRQISQNLMVQQAGAFNIPKATPLSQLQNQPQLAPSERATGNAPMQKIAYGSPTAPDDQQAKKKAAKR